MIGTLSLVEGLSMQEYYTPQGFDKPGKGQSNENGRGGDSKKSLLHIFPVAALAFFNPFDCY